LPLFPVEWPRHRYRSGTSRNAVGDVSDHEGPLVVATFGQAHLLGVAETVGTTC